MLVLCPVLALNFSGCVTSRHLEGLPQSSQPGDDQLMVRSVADPLEPLNRLTFTVNELAFHVAVNPASKGYNRVVPGPIRRGIRNFRDNLFFPLRFVSSLLQGKLSEAGTETKRFLINSTLGIGGLGNPAANKYDLQPANEDLGQAFGSWGWNSQMYLFLPIIGPSSERDALGEAGRVFLDPASLVPVGKTGLTFNKFAFEAKALEQLLATYYDPYEIARLLYTVNRDIAVRDAEPNSAQEDTGQTQTMMAVFARPKDPRFGGKARTRSVKPEGFTGALPYSLWLQDGAAPLMFVLPGLGGSRQGTRALAVAELAYKEGYHVACFSNNFNWEFIRHAPADYLPGYTPGDIDLIQQAHQAVEQDLAARHGAERVQGKLLIGFSMGAWYALNLAAQNPPATYQHSVAINPPLDLVHGLKVLDGLYRAPQSEDSERIKAIQQSAFIKVLMNRQSDPQSGLERPFTDAEASHLIGLSYRVTLREAILTGKFDNLIVPITPRRRLYDRINSIGYEDYYEKLIKPQLAPQGISAADLDVASDLRNRQAELIKANSIHLVLTSNDFLLTSEHLAWFRENFPNRHTYYEKGGHMGNLWESEVQDALRQVIRPGKTQAGAGRANP
jgi:ABC-type transporter lipoprotein component MlaA/pimeloyl-ACP methyl ester carboxylesterase